MDISYKTFEARTLELVYKTDARLTPAYVAYQVGCTVGEATQFLDKMAVNSILEVEVDDTGGLYYELHGRPSPTGEPLSWKGGSGAAAGGGGPIQIQVSHHHVGSQALAKPPKSVPLAVMLAFLFGPLGMLYSSGKGALTMFMAAIFATIFFGSSGMTTFLMAPACAIWAGAAASRHNDERQHQLAASMNSSAPMVASPHVLGRLGMGTPPRKNPAQLQVPPQASASSEGTDALDSAQEPGQNSAENLAQKPGKNTGGEI